MRPRAANMAKRPLLSSLLRMSTSYMPRPAGSPKLPGSLLGSSCQTWVSRKPERPKSTTKPMPPWTVVRAPMPAGTSSKPGNLTAGWTTAPREAIIATRACFSSAARRLRKPASSPVLQKPRGSKKPRGARAPTCLDGSKGGGGGGASSLAATFSSLAALMRTARRPAARETPAAPRAASAVAPPKPGVAGQEDAGEAAEPAALGATVPPGARTKVCAARTEAAAAPARAEVRRAIGAIGRPESIWERIRRSGSGSEIVLRSWAGA
mmetsp:Transcript_52668/g.135945  ORF Transcript_52668/g.135945 Transcript_52668/m.135945 type:complete len:266 (-) Transcript_52668:6-803(-)